MLSADGGTSDTGHKQDQLANQDYTVGWICALPTEYVAAKVFLDDEHAAPAYTVAHDNNDYTLGRIGKHNVVIAVLPSGEYGTASAAGVARDMLHSFPNVRLGLMVGIGGGAPSSKHDIRLGDVVVSEPGNGLGGVFQYDFGKNIQDQPFESTRFLAPPPQVLLTAISGLKAIYTINGHNIEQDIKNCLLRKGRLRKRFGRPEAETDRLYRSHIIHPPGEGSCSLACGVDASSVVIRRVRDDGDDDPKIHYGVIASANQLMKDAKIRDQLAEERGVLCFEMEAGGLMNQFPCLVVRGICDYSDTHKNKDWQGYAAMTAAAYAKDLLKRISPKKVEAEKKISELLESVHDTVQSTRSIVATLKSNLDAKGNIDILRWLTRSDYGDQQSDFLSRRQPGTGQWLLNSPEYNAWLRDDGQTLFCQGIPGAGKTILTSIVIEDLFSRSQGSVDVGIAYIYCDFRRTDGQRAGELLASLLKQLVGCWSTMPETVKTLYDSHKSNSTRPSIEELSSALQSVVSLFSKVFIVVDALDECPGAREHRPRFLDELSKLQTKTQSNYFATSRYIPEVEAELESTMHLDIRATKDDVRNYLDHHMMPQRVVLRENKQLQEDIKREIVEIVDGMFLLAQLHLQSFMAKTTEYDIRSGLRALRTGSNTYDEAYDEAMTRITEQDSAGRVLAEQALAWIVCAKRSLTVSELRHALAVKVDEDNFDKTRQPHIKDVISICAGLVTVDENKGTVRVVHYTTQQYLERTQRKWFPDAENDIATKCITYLSYSGFSSGFCRTDAEFEERLRVNCLYDYAAHNWGKHARAASTCNGQATIKFLRNTDNVSSASQALIASPGYGLGYSQRVPRQLSGVHLAAMFGLDFVLAALAQENNSNSKDTYLRTPLSWAAENGHEAVVKQLLEMGVPPDERSKYGRTPLSYAAASGRDCVIDILLTRREVDVNSISLSKRTPLSYAAENGHEGAVRLLLATKRIDINSKSEYGHTALSWAAANGHDNVVRLLIAEERVDLSSTSNSGQTPFSHAAANGHGAVVTLMAANRQIDVNSKSYSGQTPLSWAVRNGREEVVKLLLLHTRVNVNSKDHNDYTPFWWAVRDDKEAMIMLLLADKRVEINAKDRDGMTPLSWAATSGKTATAKLLLGNEAVDANVKNTSGDTLLLWAIKNQKDSLMQLLLAYKRVDVDCKDANGRTPLSWAVTTHQSSIARLLLETLSVDVNSKDKRGRTSLSWAVAQPSLASAFGDSKTEVIDLLLANETIDINLPDHDGLTPLLWAASHNRWTVVEKLLAREELANMNARYHDGRTTLSMAVETGSKSIVEQLIAKDAASVNWEDDDGQTPLSWSAASLNWRVVQLLLSRNDLLNLNVRHKCGRTPLSFAAADGQEKIVRQLLAQPAVDVNSKDNHGQTPLSFAVAGGRKEIVKILLAQPAVDVDSKDNYGRTPLTFAAYYGDWALVRLLLVYDRLDLDAKYDGRTALSLAAELGQVDIVELLLAKGTVDINSKDEKGQTPLSFAAAKGRWAVVGMLLANDTTDANVRHGGQTLLSLAAKAGRVDIISLLLAKERVDINSRDAFGGQTPLSWAAARCELESVRLLLRSNAVDVNVTNMEGQTPLSLAVQYDCDVRSSSSFVSMGRDQIKVIRLLLANDKIKVNCKDIHGRTPLSQAALAHKRAVVELLLEDNRVDVNAGDKDGRTPLSLVSRPPESFCKRLYGSRGSGGVGSVDFVRLMLSARMVDVNAKDNNGRTALSWAVEHEAEVAVKLLLADHRVDVNSRDNDGHTALSWSINRTGMATLVRQGHLERQQSGFRAPTAWGKNHPIVQALIGDFRVKVDEKDNEGWTPLRWAVRSVLERTRVRDLEAKIDERIEARPLPENERQTRLETVDFLLWQLKMRSSE
ncbi:hypothetical protein PWT90_06580 [Aphanocladium album]|nr:hypothetical protein PWT90_06580 [Aphanocladium album]